MIEVQSPLCELLTMQQNRKNSYQYQRLDFAVAKSDYREANGIYSLMHSQK
jgi:hypothetical protein